MVNVIAQDFGKDWGAYHADCMDVLGSIPSDCIDFHIFSPPFNSLYTFSDSDRDVSNNKTYEEFAEHYRYISAALYRVLKPGRLMSVHCMNLPLSKQATGDISLKDFRGDIIRLHEADGFLYHSEVGIWKDPVNAMWRSKAIGLLHKQVAKDSAMSRMGLMDYLCTFRKPGINPDPIEGLLTEFVGEMSNSEFIDFCRSEYANRAVKYGKLENVTKKAMTFEDFVSIMIWQRYASPVWMDIDFGKTLQGHSAREAADERHIAPLQIQVIERALQLWTMPGDTVLSPFMGIGSEGYVALKTGRKFIGAELKASYYGQAVRNLQAAEVMAGQLAMFDEEVAA